MLGAPHPSRVYTPGTLPCSIPLDTIHDLDPNNYHAAHFLRNRCRRGVDMLSSGAAPIEIDVCFNAEDVGSAAFTTPPLWNRSLAPTFSPTVGTSALFVVTAAVSVLLVIAGNSPGPLMTNSRR